MLAGQVVIHCTEIQRLELFVRALAALDPGFLTDALHNQNVHSSYFPSEPHTHPVGRERDPGTALLFGWESIALTWMVAHLAEARFSGKVRLLFPSQAQITSMQWLQALLLLG
jgi:hypothetical protein